MWRQGGSFGILWRFYVFFVCTRCNNKSERFLNGMASLSSTANIYLYIIYKVVVGYVEKLENFQKTMVHIFIYAGRTC